MTSLNTLPLPRIRLDDASHEHAWLVESRHPTSEGVVLYVRCAECHVRRVDIQAHASLPPTAVSRGTDRPHDGAA
ncbi:MULTISPECIES: hypothetical protein [Microbacterium]|uniref:hypothetical protein n=1 Tax=Microbacterium TaxID=33882 RepID=UPI00030C87A7|nr:MULTISPECIES: hypothetical protein [Microbacterium]AZH79483.1 hypothetical protein CSX12_14075 [Microbacterium sp. Y-01]MDX2399517.1 hypothetical protein [Microbacterium algeriense]